MIRCYLLPIESVVLEDGNIARGPKYFQWRLDPDPPGLAVKWGMMDYGLIDAALLVAEVTQEQHDTLLLNSDVTSPPENIDQNIASGAIPAVQAALETLRIPADWVTTAFTYRQILRMVAGLFQFAQRHHALHNEQLIDSQAQLDLRWNQIPIARRNRILATADSLNYDYSAVQNTWLIRRILKHLSDQWGVTVFHIGGFDL